MDPKYWQVGDVVRRVVPYRKTDIGVGELCRVRRVIDKGDYTIILVNGHRQTGSATHSVLRYYAWVSRGAE